MADRGGPLTSAYAVTDVFGGVVVRPQEDEERTGAARESPVGNRTGARRPEG